MQGSSSSSSATNGKKHKTNEILAKKIEAIRKQLASMTAQMDLTKQEAKDWKEKRDAAHRQTRDLRSQIGADRENRDSFNSKVSALKIQRDEARKSVREKIERIQRLRQKLSTLQDKKPRIDAESVRKEIEALEWKIQTSSLTLKEEAPLVSKANELELKLETHREIDVTRIEITGLQKEIDEANEEAGILHGKISELAEQSQSFHKRMTESLQKLKGLQDEADSYHQEFLKRVKDLETARKDHAEAETQLRALTSELSSREAVERKAEEKTTRQAVKKEVRKKLKKGEKLTFEEFKLVLEDE